MSQRKAKRINRLAAKLTAEDPDSYQDETIIHARRKRNGRRIHSTQRISGRRKAKRAAIETLSRNN